jgi:hypothetical protein
MVTDGGCFSFLIQIGSFPLFWFCWFLLQSATVLEKSGSDRHCYNLPTTPELAAFVPDGGSRRNIIIRCRGGGLKQISEWNPAYDPLTFTLLFPSGELGWEGGIGFCAKRRITKTGEVVDHDPRGVLRKGQVSIKNFAAFYMFERSNTSNHLIRARSLYEEWIVIRSWYRVC